MTGLGTGYGLARGLEGLTMLRDLIEIEKLVLPVRPSSESVEGLARGTRHLRTGLETVSLRGPPPGAPVSEASRS